MNILYGCCYIGTIYAPGHNIDYVDIIPGIEKNNGNYICTSIENINFNNYDIIICSPPCNYWSRANYPKQRENSIYAQQTKHLLPYCINKCLECNKPFIVENVINRKLMNNIITSFPYNIYYIGRHTYFTNEFINLDIEQIKTVNDITYLPRNKRQGGINVENIFNLFIEHVLERYYYE